ncbi:hypothetical protein ABID29_000142 [Streptococcus rupicaprae]|uniref:Lipoprotein n=1 Tax=Streptococcus rupicaprae TaxID=759619 RepID=A0ABV2FEP1_9STRE
MFKMFHKTVTLFSALLLLSACGSKAAEPVTSTKSSAEKVAEKQQPSTTTTSSSEGSKTSASSSTTKSQTAITKPSTTDTSASNSNLDPQAISQGDFTSLAGTWKNDLGETLVFSPDALLTENTTLTYQSLKDNVLYFSINPTNAPTGGAALTMIPAGVKSPGGLTFQQDVITSGQSLVAENHPFYRVSSAQEPLPFFPEEDKGSVEVTSGYLNLIEDTPVYAKPDKSMGPVMTYPKGESVFWDKYFSENGEFWYSYVTYEGVRYYISYTDVSH